MYNETAELTESAISKYDCVVQEPKELGHSSPSFFQSSIRPLLAWKYLEEKTSVDGD
jgi:hypothetical protein